MNERFIHKYERNYEIILTRGNCNDIMQTNERNIQNYVKEYERNIKTGGEENDQTGKAEKENV